MDSLVTSSGFIVSRNFRGSFVIGNLSVFTTTNFTPVQRNWCGIFNDGVDKVIFLESCGAGRINRCPGHRK